MIPLFKSHFSIGKSILTIDKIIELSEGEEVVVVEDSFYSFRKLIKKADDNNKLLRFGLRINCKANSEKSKVVIFAKNSEGIKSLMKLYTKAYCHNDGCCDFSDLKNKNLLTCFPFYDSFVHKAIHNFGDHFLPFNELENPIFFEENNSHPFDYQIKRQLKKIGCETTKAKTILYEKKSDFPAFQCYKASCSRKIGRKPPSFEAPELEDCSTDRFCWEDFKETNEQY